MTYVLFYLQFRICYNHIRKEILLIRGAIMNDSQIENTNEELDNLRTIRDEAINALAPNIDRMEGVDGERKIRIYMSAARITNSSKMFRLAYEAAKNIPDTATRAEALIDIIQDSGYAISKLGGGRPF